IESLLTTFVHSVQIEPRIVIPNGAYNPARHQYRAVHLLDRLNGCARHDTFRVIGLIDEDIYTPGAQHAYGAHEPGTRAIILGLRRLTSPLAIQHGYESAEAQQRIATLVVRQICSSLSLEVCFDPACTRSTETTLASVVNKSTQLCPSCRSRLSPWLR
ncbi:MAG TPA: hypothetical protein VMT34_03625, partial [Aggregatilineales bacterium]|nr:hypothetical protein [Aggregatilineales bacterium]